MSIKGCNAQVWTNCSTITMMLIIRDSETITATLSEFPHISWKLYRWWQKQIQFPQYSKQKPKTVYMVQNIYCNLIRSLVAHFVNRFPNITAIRSTVQCIGYCWAKFNSFVLLIQCSQATHPFPCSFYTLRNFFNKCHTTRNATLWTQGHW